MNYARYVPYVFALMIMSGCAGASRNCSQCNAETFGGDFVVVELTEARGVPYRCWMLRGVSISNEKNSDGIYWKDPESGNLVHISGSYDYVQVKGDNWNRALEYLNLTREACEKVRARKYNPTTDRYE